MTTWEVMVVGGGPAGASTALRLARAGREVVLVDRARFPRDKACAEYHGPGTLGQLDALGVLDEVRPAAHPIEGTTVVGPYGARLTGLFARAGGQFTHGLSIPRTTLDLALIQAAERAGVRVLQGHRVEALHRDPIGTIGAEVRDEGGRRHTLRARVAVGADGLRSRVATLLAGRLASRPSRLAFVAHMDGVTGLRDRAELHVGPASYVGLNPLGGTLSNVAFVCPTAEVRPAAGDPERFFLAGIRAFPEIAERLRSGRIVKSVMVTGPFGTRAGRIAGDGVLLVGDAAGFFDPFTGEGVCTALEGAELAAGVVNEALAHPGPVQADRLRPYARRYRKRFLAKQWVERLIGYGMFAPRLFNRAVGRLDRRDWSHTLLGVTGHVIAPRAVLNPRFLLGMIF